jgi:hypothetical protein
LLKQPLTQGRANFVRLVTGTGELISDYPGSRYVCNQTFEANLATGNRSVPGNR